MRSDTFVFARETDSCDLHDAPFELAARLNERLLNLDRDGVLFLDMLGLTTMNQECAFMTLAMLTKMIGHDLFRDKHVAVVRANARVLTSLDQAVDNVAEAYMVYDPKSGKTEVRGQGFTPALSQVYFFVARSKRPVDAHSASEALKIARSAASSRLNELHRLGFLVKSFDLASRDTDSDGRKPGGRPSVQYRVFDPSTYWAEAKSPRGRATRS